MRNKMLRSVLVAAFSAVVALGVGVLSGFSDEEGGTRANTQWPAVIVSAAVADNTQWPSPGVNGAGS
ncbi:hypothetical protein ACFW7K_11500 [Streptomyces sp. NPDC058735]|uniref:hypothetical protein n=1 Tax=Streptomyces sp. NPDC058735 TaxID=3346616 RepID=UPI0036B67A74